MTPIEVRKDQLEKRLAELNARLNRIERELDQPVSAQFGEQAIEREEDEVLEDLGQAGLQETRMIEAALGRIAKGTYGTLRQVRRRHLRGTAERAAAHAALPQLRDLSRPTP